MAFKSWIILVIITPLLLACPKNPPEDRVLVFTKTAAYVHESIDVGVATIEYLGKQNDFLVVTTQEDSIFKRPYLQQFKAVIFLNTTGDVLNNSQQVAFKDFINNGGGFVGVHAATDTEYTWPWYGQLVGAYFQSHPDQQQATLTIIDTEHKATQYLPATWSLKEEWYNFKSLSNNISPLITIDETTYNGGTHNNFHPISWFQEFDGGKMFYTALGHRIETYSSDLFHEHLLGGIQYVLGR